MANPLYNGNQGQQFIVPDSVKQMANMVNIASNPRAALNQLAATNPQLAQMLNNPYDYKSMFYQMCQQRGVNPESILNQLGGPYHGQ